MTNIKPLQRLYFKWYLPVTESSLFVIPGFMSCCTTKWNHPFSPLGGTGWGISNMPRRQKPTQAWTLSQTTSIQGTSQFHSLCTWGSRGWTGTGMFSPQWILVSQSWKWPQVWASPTMCPSSPHILPLSACIPQWQGAPSLSNSPDYSFSPFLNSFSPPQPSPNHRVIFLKPRPDLTLLLV